MIAGAMTTSDVRIIVGTIALVVLALAALFIYAETRGVRK